LGASALKYSASANEQGKDDLSLWEDGSAELQIMSSAPNDTPREPSLPAAFLSYLVPGLGQIYQGRYGKGVLFMVSLLGMFFLGQAMGQWENVYLPNVIDPKHPPVNGAHPQGNSFAGLVQRWHYGGQVWIGAAAWPALWQHFDMPVPSVEKSPFWHNYQKSPEEPELNNFLRDSDKSPDLGWVYTVIAGMLNILVMYDAYAGPVFLGSLRPTSKESMTTKATAKQEGAA
jgi:hypothetical protein